MNIADHGENVNMLRVSDSEGEDSWALCSKVTPTTRLPNADATPNDVRDFFRSLLMVCRQDTSEEGQGIVNKWKGTGREMNSYPPAMYLEIFRSEDGWFLYKETHLLKRRPKKGSGWSANTLKCKGASRARHVYANTIYRGNSSLCNFVGRRHVPAIRVLLGLTVCSWDRICHGWRNAGDSNSRLCNHGAGIVFHTSCSRGLD